MKKLLFLIHDLGPGGAEKVLVNLVNRLDPRQFDITLMALFGGGVNEQFLKPHIRYIPCFPAMIPGNSHLMKLLPPRQLHDWLIRERYDAEISWLEGPCARIVSGCPHPETKLVSWIHVEQATRQRAARSFRGYGESARCYGRFHRTVCVSEAVREDFRGLYPWVDKVSVLYNTNDTAGIQTMSREPVEQPFPAGEVHLCVVGKLLKSKGVDRIARIHKRLREDGAPVHTWFLGEGPQRRALEAFAREHGLEESLTLLGYQENPYKYLYRCDLLVCASHAEGFSTAATEALILGVPVCTVAVAGMAELLDGGKYGVITENDEDALYRAVRELVEKPEKLARYRELAGVRGKDFSGENTVAAAAAFLEELCHG